MPDDREEVEQVRFNEDAARRLIQRATELDASLGSQSSVAELREAARGAGISDEAFQRALDEVRATASAPTVRIVRPVRSNRLLMTWVMVALAVALVGFLAMFRTRPHGVAAVPAAPQQGVSVEVAPSPPPTIPPATTPPPARISTKGKSTTKVPPPAP